MHLMAFQIMAIVFTTIALLSIILMIVTKYRLIQYKNDIESDENTTIQICDNTGIKLKKRINIYYICAFGCLLLAGTAITIFLMFNSIALQYGAYERVQLAQSLDEIHECQIKGYTESPNIPDDLGGKILIYFKYGCPDCAAVHDSLMEYIKQYDVKDIYFVSSRSAKGKQLIQQYPIDEVPSGVYIRSQKSEISDTYTEVLYIKQTTSDGKEKILFNEDGFYHLLYRQSQKE